MAGENETKTTTSDEEWAELVAGVSTSELMRVRALLLATLLERMPRQGADEDRPEGARYVVVSETALDLIVAVLREALVETKRG